MSKKGARGRWTSGPRFSTERKVSDTRWVKGRRGWRVKESQVTEVAYCASRRSPVGFARGAKLPHVATHTTQDLIDSNG